MGSVNKENENKARKLAMVPHAPAIRFARLQAIDARESNKSMNGFALGRQFYLPRGSRDMAPIGPRRGGPKMIRLGDVSGVEVALPHALRVLGPDYLVPADPDTPAAQRTVLHAYGWGEMGSTGRVRESLAQREAREKEATKKAKKRR